MDLFIEQYQNQQKQQQRPVLANREDMKLQFIDLNDRFRVTDKRDLIQYATFYYKRLSILRDYVTAESKKLWNDQSEQINYMSNLLDIKPNETTVIIGTLYKEMPRKPCILANLVGVLRDTNEEKNFCSEEDYLVLEDSSGRIRIRKHQNVHPDMFATGSILGFKGQVDNNGLFDVYDYCFAGMNPKDFVTLPKQINLNIQKDIYENNPNRSLIAFISGLEFTEGLNPACITQIQKFLRGECGPQDQVLSSQIKRLVICGNSTIQPIDQDSVNRGSFRTQDINNKVYQQIFDITTKFEEFLENISAYIDIDVMPGELDFTSPLMPQQPMHTSLFMNLLANRRNVLLHTNPSEFKLNDLHFIGTSGQNIRDIMQYTQYKNPLEVMEMTLKLRHLAPTCPDTLRSYPFVENDPFIIQTFPHVYFSGNQDFYKEKLIQIDSDNRKAVKMISVPRFRETGSIVVMDLENLQSFEVKIDTSIVQSNRLIDQDIVMN